MRLVGLAVASLVLGAAPASAQYIPRPPMAIGPASAQDVSDIVQAMGLDPIGPAMQSGPFLVQRASDDFGRMLRVTVDTRRSQVVAVEPAGPPRGAYAGYAPYRRPYPGYVAMTPDDEGLAAPGSIMGPRPQPGVPQPQHHATATPNIVMPPLPPATPPRPKVKSATVTPQTAPTPRKRPVAAPQEAVGSVEPIAAQPAPASAAPAPASPPGATPPAQGLE
jgi:hypothetical protein